MKLFPTLDYIEMYESPLDRACPSDLQDSLIRTPLKIEDFMHYVDNQSDIPEEWKTPKKDSDGRMDNSPPTICFLGSIVVANGVCYSRALKWVPKVIAATPGKEFWEEGAIPAHRSKTEGELKQGYVIIAFGTSSFETITPRSTKVVVTR